MLIFILHLLIGATLGGTLVVAAIVAGFTTLYVLLGAMFAGAVLAVPISLVIARKLGARD